MFSMLQFMCRDPDSALCTVSFDVEPSKCFELVCESAGAKALIAKGLKKHKNPQALARSDTCTVNLILHNCLTRFHADIQPRIKIHWCFTLRETHQTLC